MQGDSWSAIAAIRIAGCDTPLKMTMGPMLALAYGREANILPCSSYG